MSFQSIWRTKFKMSQKTLDEAKNRLAKMAQQLELTKDQLVEFETIVRGLMEKYDMLPTEVTWALGSIGAVISIENRLKKFGN